MEKDKILGGISLDDYEIVNTESRKCDFCELEGTDCAKLLFGNGGYVCAKKVR